MLAAAICAVLRDPMLALITDIPAVKFDQIQVKDGARDNQGEHVCLNLINIWGLSDDCFAQDSLTYILTSSTSPSHRRQQMVWKLSFASPIFQKSKTRCLGIINCSF